MSLLWFPLALQQLQIKSLKSPNHRAATLAKLSFEMQAKEMFTKRTESAMTSIRLVRYTSIQSELEHLSDASGESAIEFFCLNPRATCASISRLIAVFT